MTVRFLFTLSFDQDYCRLREDEFERNKHLDHRLYFDILWNEFESMKKSFTNYSLKTDYFCKQTCGCDITPFLFFSLQYFKRIVHSPYHATSCASLLTSGATHHSEQDAGWFETSLLIRRDPWELNTYLTLPV